MQNVSMFKSETERMRCLASAPGLVFMLVASSDGNINSKKLKRFLMLMTSKEFSLLSALITQAQTNIKELLDDLLDKSLDPYQELKLVCSILDIYLSEHAALLYKATLIRLAEELARADRSILDRFVNRKISDEQQASINVIAGLLGLLQDYQGSSEDHQCVGHLDNEFSDNSSKPFASLSEANSAIYPVLKSAKWAEYTKSGTLIKTIDIKVSQDELLPVIAYAVDLQDMVEFLSTESLQNSMSIDQLHNQAMRHLESRFETKVEWKTVEFNHNDQLTEKSTGLVLRGDYYCSEALLSQKLLKQAHQCLDSEQLIAIAPVRGELYVTRITNPEQPDTLCLEFARHVVKRFFTSKQVQISPVVWIVTNGKLTGLLPELNALINQVKNTVIPIEQQEQQMVHVSKLYSSCLNTGMASNLENNTVAAVVSS
ncbi:MAG: DUF1444 family protein [Gammaproteobacteria bacterium]|nr:DUF1444 family protein [Gammaproteobacteria bacterium]